MSELKKIQLEYILRTSPKVLFSFLTEASGLSEWFCDDVNNRGGIITFIWNGDSEEHAKLISLKDNQYVKYKWLDGPEKAYFEFNLDVDEITGELALIVTDFAEPGDEEELILTWNNAIQKLHSVIGS